MSQDYKTVIVNSTPLIHECIADCSGDGRGAAPAAIAVDLEGINLCRHGRVSVMQLRPENSNVIWLVDITTLQKAAFDETDAQGRSLRGILEGNAIRKVFYDVRNDSDALFNLYGISLQNVYDLQLLELAVRSTQRESTRFLHGLGKTIPMHLEPPKGWAAVKEAGVTLFAPEKGGSYEVFDRRPLDPRLISYCAQDVALLLDLEAAMRRKLGSTKATAWDSRITKESEVRVALSRSANYDGNRNRAHALAPSGW